jgi:hypothetical protein
VEIKLDGNVFDADLERTRTYYQSNTLCTCAYCRYYRENVRQRYPKLTELLERFGVDAARPDETEPYEQDGMIEYAAVHYTVSGSILTSSRNETRLRDADELQLFFQKGGRLGKMVCPNEQEEPYFFITVWELKLPCAWASAPSVKSVFSELRRIFRRRNTKEPSRPVPPLPDAKTLAEEMSSVAPRFPLCKTLRVFYSPDKLRRAVLLRRKDKLYTFQLERLEILSEEDWTILSRMDQHRKPAMWQPDYDFGPSLFSSEANALRELRADPKTKGWTIEV